jgi:hypothetical protein
MRRAIQLASAALAALALSSIAHAQSTATPVLPGYLSTTGCSPGQTVCFMPYSTLNPLPVTGGGGGGGGGAITAAAGSYAVGALLDGSIVTLGTEADAACSTDNGTCTDTALFKRENQRLTSLITALGTPFQAGGSIGNAGFNVLQAGAATSLSNPIFVSPATGANFGGVVNVSTTPASGTTSATPNTFTTLLAASTTRKGCSFQNTSTALEYIFVGSGTATLVASYQIPAGNPFNCASSGVVIGDALQIASPVASMPYVGGAQ